MVSVNLIEDFVNARFNRFGKNRKQEVTRLLYEIAKRDKCQPEDILKHDIEDQTNFGQVKKILLCRRYPTLTSQEEIIRPYLPKLAIDPSEQADLSSRQVIPQNIYLEKAVSESALAKRLKQKYPTARIETIASYADHLKGKKYCLKDYNDRLRNYYFIEEKFDFYKHCPCSPKSVSCGYHLMNIGSGCAYECTYCFLQEYVNSPGIILPANIETFFEKFIEVKQDIRIGSGEMTDSLVFDHITEFSPQIVKFFRDYPKSTFEFKTKSNNIDLLLTVPSAGNIVISWSVNPPCVVDRTEILTANLDERLAAAKQCVEAGYLVAFHFDPVIYYQGWEKDYEALVNRIFDDIPQESIYILSLGTLRMSPTLKKIIENRFPENTILDEEMVLDYDDKLRYHSKVRRNIYEQMLDWIRKRSPKAEIYLCMEEKPMCQAVQAGPIRPYFRKNGESSVT